MEGAIGFVFDLQLFGPSSDKQQQNTAATQQIQSNQAGALQSLQQYLAANPGPVQGVGAPQAPQQMTGQIQGQSFGPPPMSPHDMALRQALAMQQQRPQMQGLPQHSAFQGQPQPGGQQMPAPAAAAPAPPGLLGLLHQ